jgi:hypothetical protein
MHNRYDGLLLARTLASSRPPHTRAPLHRPAPPPQLRRELASALRDVTALLGLPAMLQYMLQLLRSCFERLGAGNGASNGAIGGSAGEAPWVALESVLYAANVVLGRRAPEADPAGVLQLLQVGEGAPRRAVAARGVERLGRGFGPRGRSNAPDRRTNA